MIVEQLKAWAEVAAIGMTNVVFAMHTKISSILVSTFELSKAQEVVDLVVQSAIGIATIVAIFFRIRIMNKKLKDGKETEVLEELNKIKDDLISIKNDKKKKKK